MDFDKHKTDNQTDFKKVETDLSKEKSDRLSNLSFVIDQVNAVNKDIKSTYDNANAAQDKQLTQYGSNISIMNTSLTGMGNSMAMFNASLRGINNRIHGIETGFGTLLEVKDGNMTSFPPLLSLSRIQNPDINLIKNVSVLSGMTIKDVQATKQFKICGGTPERCVSFPDAQGNTYLTGFGANASLILDAPTEAKENLVLKKDLVLEGKVYGMVNGQKVELQLTPVGMATTSTPPPTTTAPSTSTATTTTSTTTTPTA